MDPGRAIAVVAAGVKTPAGCSVDELWASLLAGRPSAVRYDDPRFGPDVRVLACPVTGYEPRRYLRAPEVRRTDRSHHLAIGAADDALAALGGPVPPPERCAVVCGIGFAATGMIEQQHLAMIERGPRAVSPFAVPMVMPSSVAAHLSLRFGFTGPCTTVSTACAAGATAIAEGVELLRRGAADLVVAGGVDAALTFPGLCFFLRMDVMSTNVDDPTRASRPFDAGRDGFVLGEGAAFVVLERLADARAGNRHVQGVVLGHASTADAHHLVAPREDGGPARRCMALALADAGATAADVTHVSAHGTSTVRNDLAEAAALDGLFGGQAPPVTAPKGATGHLLGASGPAALVAAMRAIRQRRVPPVSGVEHVDPAIDLDVVTGAPRPAREGYALVNAFGFGGHNTVLVAGPG